MKVIVQHYVRKNTYNDDIEYKDGIPFIKETVCELPLKFGFGSYNEPRKVLNQGINADHVMGILPFEEPLSEEDMKNECELNGLENETPEC